MALPPDGDAVAPGADGPRPELRLVEASVAAERRCADCGRTTTSWNPVRRKGTSIILCHECAAKLPLEEGMVVCPQCGAPLGLHDAFCGKCGTKVEYACPTCGSVLEPEDRFCGKCGTRIA